MKSNNTVIISSKATLTSNGDHFNGNCKPVIAVDLQMTFNSLTDLAKYCGVHPSNVSAVLCKKQNTIGVYELDENGKRIRKIGKTHVKYADEAETVLDTIMKDGRNAKKELEKVKTENEELKKEMAEFRAWKAEQETIRKANEERELAKEKANKKLAHHERMLARVEAERERILNMIEQDKATIAKLEGNPAPVLTTVA